VKEYTRAAKLRHIVKHLWTIFELLPWCWEPCSCFSGSLCPAQHGGPVQQGAGDTQSGARVTFSRRTG
jgi:hypothetical protein